MARRNSRKIFTPKNRGWGVLTTATPLEISMIELPNFSFVFFILVATLANREDSYLYGNQIYIYDIIEWEFLTLNFSSQSCLCVYSKTNLNSTKNHKIINLGKARNLANYSCLTLFETSQRYRR